MRFPNILVLPSLLVCLSSSAAFAEVFASEEPTTQVLPSDNSSPAWPPTIVGEVVDAQNHAVADASLVYDGAVTRTDAQGVFRIASRDASPLIVMKPGFRKVLVQARRDEPLKITLQSQDINAIYLQTGHARAKDAIYQNVLNLTRTTELNAVVLNVKDDDGTVFRDLGQVVEDLHNEHVYVIARIVSFKDSTYPKTHFDPKARTHAEIVDTGTGLPWKDRKGQTYLNPFNPEAREYVLGLAKEAASEGFDEVEFDYVRFPDHQNIPTVWGEEFNVETRSNAIAGFLKAARVEVSAKGVFLAADVFGDTAYNKGDSGIGQKVEVITPYLDYVCPMLYPSGFAKGTLGFDNPAAHPEEILADSVRRYRLRADDEAVIRPWIQIFTDYQFDHRHYGALEIEAQIKGSVERGGVGFLLWGAASQYHGEGLKLKSNTRVVGGIANR